MQPVPTSYRTASRPGAESVHAGDSDRQYCGRNPPFKQPKDWLASSRFNYATKMVAKAVWNRPSRLAHTPLPRYRQYQGPIVLLP